MSSITPTVYRQVSNQTSAGTIAWSTDLQFVPSVNTTYYIEAWIYLSSNAGIAATGLSISAPPGSSGTWAASMIISANICNAVPPTGINDPGYFNNDTAAGLSLSYLSKQKNLVHMTGVVHCPSQLSSAPTASNIIAVELVSDAGLATLYADSTMLVYNLGAPRGPVPSVKGPAAKRVLG